MLPEHLSECFSKTLPNAPEQPSKCFANTSLTSPNRGVRGQFRGTFKEDLERRSRRIQWVVREAYEVAFEELLEVLEEHSKGAFGGLFEKFEVASVGEARQSGKALSKDATADDSTATR